MLRCNKHQHRMTRQGRFKVLRELVRVHRIACLMLSRELDRHPQHFVVIFDRGAPD